MKSLRGFLGLTKYYCKFIHDYGEIAKPLTELLKKGAFLWYPQAQLASKQLKETMTHNSVMGLLQFREPFRVETNASDKGIGAVFL